MITHSTHRVRLWWKMSPIFGRISLPSSGDGNQWLLVSHDPSGSRDTSWRVTAGIMWTTPSVLQKYVPEFTEHINNIDSNIKFTMEEPENNTIALLDTKVTVQNDGSTNIQVYIKPTHTEQYLNWESNQPLENKRSVIRTLLGRVDQVVSEEQDKTEEKEQSCEVQQY